MNFKLFSYIYFTNEISYHSDSVCLRGPNQINSSERYRGKHITVCTMYLPNNNNVIRSVRRTYVIIVLLY